MIARETDWREMFIVETIDDFLVKTETVGDCNGNCLEAKELICVCKCKGRNHGAALKQHVQPLDQFSEKETGEDPVDPVDQCFNPEEYAEELAVLA